MTNQIEGFLFGGAELQGVVDEQIQVALTDVRRNLRARLRTQQRTLLTRRLQKISLDYCSACIPTAYKYANVDFQKPIYN